MTKEKHDKKNKKDQEVKEAVKEAKEDQKEKCDKKIDNKDAKIEELTDLLRRTQAEFINFRDRTAKEASESAYYYKKDIITKLLPVLDMFELALKHKKEDNDFTKGMEMIYAQLISTLENEGLQIIKTNDKFNPELHEAVITEDSEKEENTILEELQKGYMLNNKVIRYSRVKVSKKNEKE